MMVEDEPEQYHALYTFAEKAIYKLWEISLYLCGKKGNLSLL